MENSLYIALSRQTTLWRQLDMVSNNLANMNTSGYKGVNPLFTEYLTKTPQSDKAFKYKLSYTQDFGVVQDFSEGPIKKTDNPLDLAIHGDAFFAIETPDGEKYSRAGQFKLDNQGQIVTADGYPVMSEQNTPFFVAPNEKEIIISKDGSVSTENGQIGKIKLVSFDSNQKLLPTYGGLFETKEDNVAQPAQDVDVIQGAIEESNVQPVVEMTKLIAINRNYNHVQKMIDEEHSRQKKAVDILSQRAR